MSKIVFDSYKSLFNKDIYIIKKNSKMIFRNMLSGKIFALMLIEVEMAISNAIFNLTKNSIINIHDILIFTIHNI